MTDSRELYSRWIEEVWSGRKRAEDLVSPAFVGHLPDRTLNGPEELQQVIDGTLQALPAARYTVVVGPLVDGELVAGRWNCTGRLADGTDLNLSGNDVLRVEDGRFVEYWIASSTSS